MRGRRGRRARSSPARSGSAIRRRMSQADRQARRRTEPSSKPGSAKRRRQPQLVEAARSTAPTSDARPARGRGRPIGRAMAAATRSWSGRSRRSASSSSSDRTPPPAEIAGQLAPRRVGRVADLPEPAEHEAAVGIQLDEQAALGELAPGPQELKPGARVPEGEETRRPRRRPEGLGDRRGPLRLRAVPGLDRERHRVADPAGRRREPVVVDDERPRGPRRSSRRTRPGGPPPPSAVTSYSRKSAASA